MKHLTSYLPLFAPIALLAAPGAGQTTIRVNVSSTGAQANAEDTSTWGAHAISADGRYVAFVSPASNLVPGDTNGVADAFVRDLATGALERVSVATSGQEGVGDRHGQGTRAVTISADGRHVAFMSAAGRLVGSVKSAGTRLIYVRDRASATTELVSVSTSGGAPAGECLFPSISADGRHVAFTSAASNLVAGDRNKTWDVFVRDRGAQTTRRASTDSTGREGNGMSTLWSDRSLSADGSTVVFASWANNLVAGDTNSQADGFAHDLVAGTTTRVTLDRDAGQLATSLWVKSSLALSADGRFVAFTSQDPAQLPPNAPTGLAQGFLFDRINSTTECVTLGPDGTPADAGVGGYVVPNADARFVAFTSRATNLVPGGTGLVWGAFVRDRATGLVALVSRGSAGGWPNGDSYSPVSITPDASSVVFSSQATDLVPGDSNGLRDVFAVR